ncbi:MULTISPECIES: LysR family transcriptional regulator [unclassified Pseudoalteromonas]|uniref:LysR family transcriptional regulator n=1 Tax=unclassified Pseudoalteromonas TaxID=194690 RepID=UPI000C7E7BC9|nr:MULTISPECIES: LysR family transcriptional regulator [unclassified Pseudoalteromonas]AUJ72464.1 DNA-binding transcriptional regulator DsdC [Pseudoalteromonas sp. NC201]MCX2767638.1 LysR family transcriptional regulator [Pseudoalteromonas sp. B530]
MENWDDFQLLLALKRANTLRGAAKVLGVNHTTVSRRLHALNQRFSLDICMLSQGKVSFSELGLQLLSAAENMEASLVPHLSQINTSVKQLKQQINLSIPPAILQFVLLDELHEFQQNNPYLTLSINTTYALSDLEKSEADVVIRASHVPDEHLVGHRLFPISLGYFMHKDYLDNRTSESVSWITASVTERPTWLLDTPYPTAPVSLSIEDLVLRHQAASKGLGMIRGAHYIARHFPNLIEFAPASEHYADLWILTHPTKKSIPNVKRLISFLLKTMRSKQILIDCAK